MFKANKPKLLTLTIVLTVTVALVTVLTAGLLSNQKTVTNTGTISTINVDAYTDAQCTTPCTSIDWGTLNEGSTASKTIYVKNTGNTPETLTMSTSGWNPSSASSILTLTWDKQDSTLAAGSSVAATLKLTTAADAGSLTSFSFNLVIQGAA